MPTAIFVESDGTEHPVEVAVGENLKQAAIDRLVPGLIGDCGGFAECGTCHGYIDNPAGSVLPEVGEDEEIMLESLLGETRETSRLTCQLAMTPALDGVVVRLPETQG